MKTDSKFGLSGLPGSGKDTVLDAVKDTWCGVSLKQIALGDVVRRFAAELFGGEEPYKFGIETPDAFGATHQAMQPFWRDPDIDRDPYSRSPEMRTLLQTLGDVVPDQVFFSELDKLIASIPQGEVGATTGVRRVSEADFWRSRGFVMIRLDCPVETCRRRIASRDGFSPDLASFDHPLERQLDNYKFDAHVSTVEPDGVTDRSLVDIAHDVINAVSGVGRV